MPPKLLIAHITFVSIFRIFNQVRTNTVLGIEKKYLYLCRNYEAWRYEKEGNPDSINEGLLRLKIMELLYDVSECSKNIFRQILHLRQPARADLRQVVEQHYATPLVLKIQLIFLALLKIGLENRHHFSDNMLVEIEITFEPNRNFKWT